MDLEIKLSANGIVDIYPDGVEQPVNAVVLSVLIPRGEWWQSPEFGSRLHTLFRSKATGNLAEMVKNYLIEATRHLTESGIASRVEVEAWFTDKNRIDYKVTVSQGSKPFSFRWFWGEPRYVDIYEVDDIYAVEDLYAIF
jgi:phage gp46-like protein